MLEIFFLDIDANLHELIAIQFQLNIADFFLKFTKYLLSKYLKCQNEKCFV